MKDKIVIELNNELVECQVLFTFTVSSNKKTYVGYTDGVVENGRKNLYISYFDKDKGYDKAHKIENDKELELFRQVLEMAQGD